MTRSSASTWHEERYAAGEGLAYTARKMLAEIERDGMLSHIQVRILQAMAPELHRDLAEYERTKDHP